MPRAFVLAAILMSSLILLTAATPASARAVDRGEMAIAATTGAASPTDGDLPELSLAELLPLSDRFHRDVLAQIRLSERGIEPLRSDLVQAHVDRDDAEVRRVAAHRRRSARLRDRWAHRVVLDERRTAEESAATAEDVAQSELGAFGVGTFLESTELDLAKIRVDGIASPFPQLTSSTGVVLTDRLARARSELTASRLLVAEAERAAIEIDETIAEAEEELAAAEADLADALARIDDLTPRLERIIYSQRVAGTDIPLVVIDAYFVAARSMAERRPTCGVTWDQLAGIGLIETRHGSFGGSTVDADGQTSKKILGPVLNGEEFAAIADTDGGALDGDLEWDRAVGPMQFIPGSWKIYRLDGNGDGTLDPHNMYDAAFSAAEHLCRSTNRLDRDGNYRIALLGYNRSEQYGIDVMAARERYRQAVDLVPLPDPPEPEDDDAGDDAGGADDAGDDRAGDGADTGGAVGAQLAGG